MWKRGPLNLDVGQERTEQRFRITVAKDRPSVEEASINLGVPPIRSFIRVVIPVMLPGIIAGAIIMWVTTLAELSSTIVLYYGPWATMTVEVFQRIGSGDFGPASAYATILILSVLIPLFILNRVSGKDLASSL